jgi:hypothetical protein
MVRHCALHRRVAIGRSSRLRPTFICSHYTLWSRARLPTFKTCLFVNTNRTANTRSLTTVAPSPPQHPNNFNPQDTVVTSTASQAQDMKYLIICAAALATTTLATLPYANDVANLAARAIDPKTMDPTRLSVLSVLRTAVPSGSAFPQPTGDAKPDWYQKLPEDVKSLLPLLYPAAATSASSSATVTVSNAVLSAATSSSTSEMVSHILRISAVQAPLIHCQTSSVASAAASAPSSLSLCASQVTVTKTLQFAPSASAGYLVPSNSSFAPTNGTVAPALPTPSSYFSAGARTATNVAVLTWIGVGIGFFVFA